VGSPSELKAEAVEVCPVVDALVPAVADGAVAVEVAEPWLVPVVAVEVLPTVVSPLAVLVVADVVAPFY
jgi:collagenase-like PrtC family protease